MPEVASVSEKTQIGLEAIGAPGTSVAATKILTASQITPGPQITTNAYRASGFKVNAINVKGKEWTEASLAGPLTFTEVPYWLSGIIARQITGTVPTGAPVPTVTKQYDFALVSNSPEQIQTFTIEQGSVVRAKKFTYGLLTAWGFSATRDNINMTGTLLGQLMSDAITMTPLTSTAELPLIPVLPDQVNIKMASTQAGLAAAIPLNRAFQLDFNIASRFNPVWPLKRASPSFAAHVETPIDLTAALTTEADAEGMAILTTMRSGAPLFIEMEAVGAETEPGIVPAMAYTFTIQFCANVTEPGGYEDQDGVLANTWGLGIVHDPVWGKALNISVRNKLTSL